MKRYLITRTELRNERSMSYPALPENTGLRSNTVVAQNLDSFYLAFFRTVNTDSYDGGQLESGYIFSRLTLEAPRGILHVDGFTVHVPLLSTEPY